MAVASHPENFFQTTSSIEEIERRKRKAANTQGSPIQLPSKILAVEVNRDYDSTGDTIITAEAGGLLSRVNLSTNEVKTIGRGSQTPLTSLTHCQLPDNSNAIFAGAWDKTISKFTFTSSSPPSLISQTNFKAHSDFVKCLCIARTQDDHTILISGGADSELNIWNPTNNTRLATLKPQSRGIESIALDPFSNQSTPTIFFSTSQREIFSFQLPPLHLISSQTVQATLSAPLIVHETSVYKLHFDASSDLWTASADKTAKRLLRDSSWQVDLTLQHPDFVKDVVTHPRLPYVATACRDEEVRLWNANTGDIIHVFAGHYEQVTGLAVLSDLLISVSIDATVRKWSLRPEDLAKEIEKAKSGDLLEDNAEPDIDTKDLGLTEEEEAELKALMEEEEEESLEKMALDAQ